MRRVRISSDGWSTDASRAETFVERLAGLSGPGVGDRLLIPARSVHTIGMRQGIEVVMIDEALRVIRSQPLAPRRIAFERSARYVLELPAGAVVPADHSQLTIDHV